MAIEWIPVVAKAAVGAATSTAVREAYAGAKGRVKGLLSDALSKGPLAESLEVAYREGFTGFSGSLEVAFPIDDEEIERGLQALASHKDFAATVGQLPYIPFEKIDTTRARELFLNLLGPEGMEDRDFEAAWRAFGLRFERAAAKDQNLKNLLDLTRAARQEKNLEEMRQLLQRLTDSAEAAARIPDPEPALRKYRESLYQRYRYADTRGLFLREKEGVGEGIELRQVFVETPLARLVEKKEKDREGKEQKGKKERLPEEAPREEVRKFGEVLARDRLFVVFGPPGSGKSTLLRCLCLTLCRPDGVKPLLDHSLLPEVIPVLLQLKEFASALRETSSLELDHFLLKRLEGRVPGLEDLLNSGRALVLLDGLDEVFDESHRRWVSEEVWRLVSRFPDARFVLTSRPHGYQAAPLPGPVPRWQLQPFGDREIGRFLRGWFEALAREGGEVGVEEPPEKRAETLTAEILARPNLKEMAQNPLLCTLIVLVHRSRSGRLPERRVLFYEAAVRTFAEVWERSKYSPKQEGQEKLDIPEPEILLRALAEVAWRTLHQLESREIPGLDLRAWLLDYLNREPAWRGERGERAVRDLLSLVRDRTGLLIDLGGDRYQFVHLSLHEWLVSYFLLDRLKEAERKVVVRHYLHASEWEEILRLLIAGAPQAQADELIQSIHSQPTNDLEKLLRRDLLFIQRCLADQAPVGPETRRALDKATAAVLSDSALIEPLEFLRNLADTGPAVHGAVLLRLSYLDHRVRCAAVEHLSYVGARDYKTREAIFSRLNDKAWTVRHAAVKYFMRVGMYDSEARRSIMLLLWDEHQDVRCAAVEYFIRVNEGDPEIRRAVMSCLRDDHQNVRGAALDYFIRIGGYDAEARRAVLSRLSSNNWRVRRAALEYFSRIEEYPIEVRETVLSSLSHNQWEMRALALGYLVQVGWDDPEMRDAVYALVKDEATDIRDSPIQYYLERLSNTSSEEKRMEDTQPQEAEGYSNRIEKVNHSKISAVIPRLRSTHMDVRLAAFRFLLQSGFEGSIALEMLEKFENISDSTSSEEDLRFSEMIGHLAATDEQLKVALLRQGTMLQHFQMGPALRALASEEDRLRRLAKPLRLPKIPGCEPPEFPAPPGAPKP